MEGPLSLIRCVLNADYGVAVVVDGKGQKIVAGRKIAATKRRSSYAMRRKYPLPSKCLTSHDGEE